MSYPSNLQHEKHEANLQILRTREHWLFHGEHKISHTNDEQPAPSRCRKIFCSEFPHFYLATIINVPVALWKNSLAYRLSVDYNLESRKYLFAVKFYLPPICFPQHLKGNKIPYFQPFFLPRLIYSDYLNAWEFNFCTSWGQMPNNTPFIQPVNTSNTQSGNNQLLLFLLLLETMSPIAFMFRSKLCKEYSWFCSRQLGLG